MCVDNFDTHLAAFQDKGEIADDSSREASLSIANAHDSIPLSLQIKILLSQPQLNLNLRKGFRSLWQDKRIPQRGIGPGSGRDGAT